MTEEHQESQLEISIHAPREGGDTNYKGKAKAENEFQSTPPARGATPRDFRRHKDPQISIHAPREGGDNRDTKDINDRFISIHAPREGGDTAETAKAGTTEISIHAPREGGDNKNKFIRINKFLFQSTPPARGATQK